ncbi:response regulator [Croceivirga sp. JEA036]|uniref:response regulator n=1 Tax=Croceivirga sp. JEA036 TaxID=2721162 RepID=UPI0014390B06|nr:response regulator transcription factor [Croceivirga sp. JEA036]NJB35814.1 response regulator transcription factor [Croceivirga sp. JEA036]
MNANTIKVIVIDNDPISKKKFETYFSHLGQYSLIGTYDSFTPVLDNYKKLNPDIIISEVKLQGISGLEGVRALRDKKVDTKCIMISEENNLDLIKKAFKVGVNGFLSKPLTLDRLLNALESVKQEGTALSYDVAKKVVAVFQKKQFDFLSKRENQIADLLMQGHTYKTIAQQLYVTPSTVNFHIQNIYLKLNVNSKWEALEKLREMEMAELKSA